MYELLFALLGLVVGLVIHILWVRRWKKTVDGTLEIMKFDASRIVRLELDIEPSELEKRSVARVRIERVTQS